LILPSTLNVCYIHHDVNGYLKCLYKHVRFHFEKKDVVFNRSDDNVIKVIYYDV